jgi:diacylglycerol kinase (ATP)
VWLSIHFIANARAAGGSRAERLAAVEASALGRFPDAQWTRTCAAGDAVTMAEAAGRCGADLVVAVGGDGTINEVVNGLMALPETRRPALGILPSGSGSDFVRSIGVPHELPRALEILGRGKSKRIDVGEITCAPLWLDPGSPGHVTRRYFVNMAGCGASGRVVERFNQRRVAGALGYVVASGLTALDYEFPQVDMVLDGVPAEPVRLNLLFVCNGQFCGGGMHVGKDARLDDGLLQIVYVADVSRLGSALQWPRLYTGQLERVRGAHVQMAATLTVRSREDVLVDCDGELCGRLPVTYRAVPAALSVCVA